MRPDTQRKILLKLENVGCIRHIQIALKPGLNIIRAPNASGKTSLIKGLTSMFSDRIPPAHILALDDVRGRIEIKYDGRTYKKILRRTPSGAVVVSGGTLPFADHRAFDACVALAETGVVHKITGGGTAFRQYLETLSYGKYYSTIISIAQELVNELSRELAGPNFKKFEALPLLLTELTEQHMKKEQFREKIENLQTEREGYVQSLLREMEEIESTLSRGEMSLSELRRNLAREEDKEQQLVTFLELTDDSTKVADQIKEAMADSKERQDEIKAEIVKQNELLERLKSEVTTLRSQIDQEKNEETKGLEKLKRKLDQINKAIILKEEEIQRSERFPPDDQKYSGCLVIEVRGEMIRKIEWLDKVTKYFQDKYMRRMTTTKLRFNRNITKAFKELDLKGFENLFLDQDFSLHVVRENSVQQPVETLSASEKLTISLILMLAAKETFLSDFPLFIVDELMLSYDQGRFRQIVNYITKRVPYVILTSLTSSGIRGKPQVEHKA
jgi:DNA repair exonuclease SbcCD ATPase subunit